MSAMNGRYRGNWTCRGESRARKNWIFPTRGKRRLDMWLHRLGYELDHRNHDGIAKLAIGLGIGNLNPKTPVAAIEAH